MKKRLSVLLISLSLIVPFGVMAQEETPSPEPTFAPTPVVVVEQPPNEIPVDEPGELPVTTPETLLGQFYSLLKDATYITWAAAGTIVIVGLLKVLASGAGITISGNTAIFLTLLVQVLIWIGYAVANYLNQGEAFKTWYLALVDVARSLLPLAGAIFAGHVGFKAAQKRNVPILGYSAK